MESSGGNSTLKRSLSELSTPGHEIKRSHSVSSQVSVSSVGSSDSTNFNDLIHKSIRMEGLCLKIINTPQFQRLRDLKQLGTSDFVFPGATHTRFAHSLGVAHLAEKLVRNLKIKQPELHISENDILCVKVAGLIHDLGHGPFSHVFDGVFIKMMGVKWRHEDGSVQMFNYLLQSNHIDLETYGLTSDDQLFIEEIVGGVKEGERKGRPPSKFYLYDIVNNQRSGLDVDKLDYLERDPIEANVQLQGGDFSRFIDLARVCESEPIKSMSSSPRFDALAFGQSPSMICFPEKLVREAIGIFETRYLMHQFVYTHKTVKKVEFMICDALVEADPFLFFKGTCTAERPDGLYRMSECIQDMAAFSQLNDSVLDILRFEAHRTSEPALVRAAALIQRCKSRDLYPLVGQVYFLRGTDIDDMTEEMIAQELLEISHELATDAAEGDGGCARKDQDEDVDIFTLCTMSPDVSRVGADMSPAPPASLTPLTPLGSHELIVEKMHIHYGMKEKNPVANLRFFPKVDASGGGGSAGRRARAREVPEAHYDTLLPRRFEEKRLRVFCRTREAQACARRAMDLWCQRRQTHSPVPSLSQPQDDDDGFPSHTHGSSLTMSFPDWFGSQ